MRKNSKCVCVFLVVWSGIGAFGQDPAPVKAALAMMRKIESEEVRLPLVAMSEGNKERLRKILEAQGLLPDSAAKLK